MKNEIKITLKGGRVFSFGAVAANRFECAAGKMKLRLNRELVTETSLNSRKVWSLCALVRIDGEWIEGPQVEGLSLKEIERKAQKPRTEPVYIAGRRF